MSANIEALVKKHAGRHYDTEADIRAALTEQVETHAIELRAYETTVAELTRRVEAQSVAVVGEPVAWVIFFEDTEVSPEVFMGEGAELAARHRHKELLLRWACHLLTTAPTNSITAAELATLREKAARLKHELETERMRLAACGVIALANTADSAFKARDMLPEYWSASAQDCASTVDREMDYRSRLAVAERERDELRKDAERYRWLREQSWDAGELCIVSQPKHAVKLGHDCPSLFRLDAAIDAAIAQGKGE